VEAGRYTAYRDHGRRGPDGGHDARLRSRNCPDRSVREYRQPLVGLDCLEAVLRAVRPRDGDPLGRLALAEPEVEHACVLGLVVGLAVQDRPPGSPVGSHRDRGADYGRLAIRPQNPELEAVASVEFVGGVLVESEGAIVA